MPEEANQLLMLFSLSPKKFLVLGFIDLDLVSSELVSTKYFLHLTVIKLHFKRTFKDCHIGF